MTHICEKIPINDLTSSKLNYWRTQRNRNAHLLSQFNLKKGSSMNGGKKTKAAYRREYCRIYNGNCTTSATEYNSCPARAIETRLIKAHLVSLMGGKMFRRALKGAINGDIGI